MLAGRLGGATYDCWRRERRGIRPIMSARLAARMPRRTAHGQSAYPDRFTPDPCHRKGIMHWCIRRGRAALGVRGV